VRKGEHLLLRVDAVDSLSGISGAVRCATRKGSNSRCYFFARLRKVMQTLLVPSSLRPARLASSAKRAFLHHQVCVTGVMGHLVHQCWPMKRLQMGTRAVLYPITRRQRDDSPDCVCVWHVHHGACLFGRPHLGRPLQPCSHILDSGKCIELIPSFCTYRMVLCWRFVVDAPLCTQGSGALCAKRLCPCLQLSGQINPIKAVLYVAAQLVGGVWPRGP
jgi:hypothetical protein